LTTVTERAEDMCTESKSRNWK